MLNLPVITKRVSNSISDDPPPISPQDIGLPAKFQSWRSSQWSGIQRVIESPRRFVVICMPTGSGKTLVSLGAAILSGGRTVMLTATKGLQDQVSGEMESLVSDIRGLNNYLCPIADTLGIPRDTSVADAPCQCGYRCPRKTDGGCDYYDKYRTAQRASITVTNFQCWMHDGNKPESDRGDLQYGVIPQGIDDPEQQDIKDKQGVKLLIADECFPAGTMVGDTPIEALRAGDNVPSFNEKTGCIESRRIVRVFSRKSKRLCKVNFSNGKRVTCTANHPFLTNIGWVPAALLDLSSLAVLYCANDNRQISRSRKDEVCSVRQEDAFSNSASETSIQKEGKSAVQLDVCRENSSDSTESKGVERSDEEKQSFIQQSGSAGEVSYQKTNGSKFVCGQSRPIQEMERRDRRDVGTRCGLGECSRVAYGGLCASKDEKDAGVTYPLSLRHSEFDSEGRYRSGRRQSFLWQDEKSRSKTGQYLDWVGVDSVEIHEPRSGDGPEEVRASGVVYNLEVEGTHTYFANGFVVHNCHDAADQLGMFMGVDFSRHECLTMKLDWPDSGMTVDDWQQWATAWKGKVGKRVGDAESKMKSNGGRGWSRDIKYLRDIKRKLDRLSGMQSVDGWILNENDVSGKSMTSVRFDPLSPARYAEETLWRNIPKIVLVSATVRPKTAELLGIPNSDLEFVEYDSAFDPKRRPIIHVPTGVRVTYRTEQDDQQMKWWLGKMDSVIEPRLHRKGLIHAVSYSRAMFIKSNSQFGEHMLIHNARDRQATVERYKRVEPPCILVSPSVGTGYDFAGDLCRWQLICKLPFASIKDKLIKARQEKDKEYGLYLTAQEIVQISGRPVRSESDWAETLIMDDSWLWYYWRARKYMPMWFQEAVVWADGVLEVMEFDK